MSKEKKQSEIYDSCPHCGQKLSPWQQVLLGVDRALTCKSCWYRIILEPPVKGEDEKKTDENKSKFEE